MSFHVAINSVEAEYNGTYIACQYCLNLHMTLTELESKEIGSTGYNTKIIRPPFLDSLVFHFLVCQLSINILGNQHVSTLMAGYDNI
jgi:hypothetical protein